MGLLQQAESIRKALGLTKDVAIPGVLAQANARLGLEAEGPLPAQADRLLRALGLERSEDQAAAAKNTPDDDHEAPDFIPSAFHGPREGYFFKLDRHGLGYYREFFPCPLCLDDVRQTRGSAGDEQLMDSVRFACRHRFCRECAIEMVALKVRERAVTPADLCCPWVDGKSICKRPLRASEVTALLEPDLAQRYLEWLARDSAPKPGEVHVECAMGCGAMWAVGKEDPDETVCPKCKAAFCRLCGGSPHPGRTCEQAKADMMQNLSTTELENLRYLAQETVRCPACENACQLQDGCKFAYCTDRCRRATEFDGFCILCGEGLKESQHFSHFGGDPFGNWCENHSQVAERAKHAETRAMHLAADAVPKDGLPDVPDDNALGLEEVYGPGASRYNQDTLRKWKRGVEAATAAAERGEWREAVALFQVCCQLRPDWAQGYTVLDQASAKLDVPDRIRFVLGRFIGEAPLDSLTNAACQEEIRRVFGGGEAAAVCAEHRGLIRAVSNECMSKRAQKEAGGGEAGSRVAGQQWPEGLEGGGPLHRTLVANLAEMAGVEDLELVRRSLVSSRWDLARSLLQLRKREHNNDVGAVGE